MYDTNAQIIIDTLVDRIKNLQIDVMVKDAKIEKLQKELEAKEVANG